MVFVRSPHAHARIVSIDTPGREGDARCDRRLHRRRPAGRTASAHSPTFAGLMNAEGKPMAAPPYYPLAVDEVRFVGEAVAAVVAQTRLQAEDAAEQVAVGVRGAARGGRRSRPPRRQSAPQIWPDAPGNIAAQTEFGDKQAMRCRLRQGQARHQAVLLQPAADPGQHGAARQRRRVRPGERPHHAASPAARTRPGLQKTLAEEILKLPMDKVRVRVGDVGGGFGMKTMLYPEDAVCAYAARKLGRPSALARHAAAKNSSPARTAATRSIEAELAFDADGKILGLRVEHRRQRRRLRHAAPVPSSWWRSARR